MDLHELYKQVTAHGGMREVITKKLWKDVAAPFNFPKTITSVSTVLRRVYTQFLWHMEQVYFQGKRGCSAVPPPTESGHAAKDPSKAGGRTFVLPSMRCGVCRGPVAQDCAW